MIPTRRTYKVNSKLGIPGASLVELLSILDTRSGPNFIRKDNRRLDGADHGSRTMLNILNANGNPYECRIGLLKVRTVRVLFDSILHHLRSHVRTMNLRRRLLRKMSAANSFKGTFSLILRFIRRSGSPKHEQTPPNTTRGMLGLFRDATKTEYISFHPRGIDGGGFGTLAGMHNDYYVGGRLSVSTTGATTLRTSLMDMHERRYRRPTDATILSLDR